MSNVFLRKYYISLFLMIFFSLPSNIFSSKLKDGDTVSLILYEYGFNQTSFNLSLLNEKRKIYDKIISRLAYFSDLEKDSEILDYYTKYFNRIWIFFADNTSIINSLLAKDYDKYLINILAILIPDNLNYKMPEGEKNNNKDIPVFSISSNFTDQMKNSDIRKAAKDTSFLLYIERKIKFYPENYLLIVSLLFLLIGVGFIVYWKILMKIVRAINILTLHKLLLIVIRGNIFLGIALLVKAISIRGEEVDSEYESSIFIDAILIIIDSIYRTSLWFFILLTSHGWGISAQELGRDDYKFFFKMFFFIYIVICLDQLIDSFIDTIWVFQVSEIKNILFYTYLFVLIIKKIKFNIKFLQRKYYYSLILSPEYIDAILYKIKVLKKLRIMICFYLPLYLTGVVLHKTVFYPYDNPLLELFDYLIVDIIIQIFFLIILRPKELPENYSVDFGQSVEEDTGMIYNYKLPNYSEAFSKEEKISKNLINAVKEKEVEIPIVVIGPNNKNTFNNSFIRSGPDVNDLAENDINKYFNHLNIGYYSSQ